MQNDANSRHSAQRIAIFNHKGGVGKTTLTVNIAAALANEGKNVLLVDSDPQCNLTSYLVEDSVVNDLLDHSDDEGGGTIWSAVKPIAYQEGDAVPINPITLSNGVLLLPGDISLADFERALAPLWSDCLVRKRPGFRGTTALSRLVNEIAIANDIDFVFYDSGPNIGALNRVILLDCDHFIVPAACDVFSVRAIKTLGHTLAGWIQDWSTISDLAPDEIYLLPGLPKFAGYIPQRFKVYAGGMASEFASYIPRLERALASDLIAVLRKVAPETVSPVPSPLKIGEVKDFASAASASQRKGAALWELDGLNQNQRDAAWGAFEEITRRLLKRMPVPSR
jgi:cellulose biosynthesis protein BcsQ